MTTPKIPHKKEKQKRMAQIVSALEVLYPDATCALEYEGEAWKLLVMARLSAQCTDARVNLVCRELFRVYPTLQELADAPLASIEELIRPCGLFRTKAESIKAACTILTEQYGGRVPDTMEELLALPGVGRKIANLMLGDIYGKPAVVTDTHCIRICGRLGMYPQTLKDPPKIEAILKELIVPEKQSDFCHRIVQFGRDVCSARNPACEGCPLARLCDHEKMNFSLDL